MPTPWGALYSPGAPPPYPPQLPVARTPAPARAINPPGPRCGCLELGRQLAREYDEKGKVSGEIYRQQHIFGPMEPPIGNPLPPYSPAWLDQIVVAQEYERQLAATNRRIANTLREIGREGCTMSYLPSPARAPTAPPVAFTQRQAKLLDELTTAAEGGLEVIVEALAS